MKRKVLATRYVLSLLALVLFGFANPALAEKPPAETEPLPLDLSPFNKVEFVEEPAFEEIEGRHKFDGIPFDIDGRSRLFGKTPDEERSSNSEVPHSFEDIKVARKFDDLYLIHHAHWPGVEGEVVAYVCLTYADDTGYITPLRYGAHVRDWYHLPSYALEEPTDPQTKICWTHEPWGYKSPLRIFKSRIDNPFPDKVVTKLDFVSAGNLASYTLMSATVANRDARELPQDPPPEKWDEPKREFNGQLTVRVVDAETGEPLAGVLVKPSMTVDDEGVVAAPFLTSEKGEGVIPYRRGLTDNIYVDGNKAGYRREYESLQCDGEGNFAKECVLSLSPE